MNRQREPRERDPAYLGWVARCPCVACMFHGTYNPQVQVAHLRAANDNYGKRGTGMGEKPGDRWVTPLCMPHHTGDVRKTRRTQHHMDEVEFWESMGINPFELCNALVAAYVAGEPGRSVIAKFAAAGRRKMEAA